MRKTELKELYKMMFPDYPDIVTVRKDKKTAARIIEDNPKIKENILIEENMRSRYFGFNKSRKRGYER